MICPICKQPITLAQPIAYITKYHKFNLAPKLKVFELMIGMMSESEEFTVHKVCIKGDV